MFPHVYSALTPSAVMLIEPFDPEPNGMFTLPKTVAELCCTVA
ncbi:MAG: hypothetical protein WCK47_06440 [bacterium]|nr:hypothetical protein [Candidatus Sumerlaeota bacterium]